jgi:DNA-binding PadR family transcriptional regulator
MSNRASTASKLAPGDFVFLAFLTWEPMTAYDIKKFMAESVSNFWSTAHSQVYQQARRLVRDGFVREQALPGARRKRVLHLTPKGRRAVMHWLRQPAQPPQYFSEAMVKLFFAAQAGDLKATKRMLEQDRDRNRGLLAGFEALMPVLQAAEEDRYPAMTLDLGIRLHRALAEWADDTLRELDQDLRRAKGSKKALTG